MSDYTIRPLTEVPDIFDGQYPGAMRFLTDHLEAQQVAFTHRVMPPKSGGKGGYGHRHKTQEEIYFVIDGAGRVKLDDELVELRPLDLVRVSPGVARCFEAGPEGLQVLIFGPRVESDGESVNGFWDE